MVKRNNKIDTNTTEINTTETIYIIENTNTIKSSNTNEIANAVNITNITATANITESVKTVVDITTVVKADSPMMAWAKSQANEHIAMGHIGTHLDTYEKSNIPIRYFKSQGIIFDVRNIEEIGLTDIDISKVMSNYFVIFRTGQMEKFGYEGQEYFNNHPQLSNELITALIAKKIRFIGVDCAGIRQNEQHKTADILCENNGVYVIENLGNLYTIQSALYNVKCELDNVQMNLENIQSNRDSDKSSSENFQRNEFTVYTMWHDNEKMTGLKCRVLVEF